MDLMHIFYKVCWQVIEENVSSAIMDFFQTASRLKLKATLTVLVPKVKMLPNLTNFGLFL